MFIKLKEKALKFEKACFDFITKNYFYIFILFLFLLSLLIRYKMRNFISGDMRDFLIQWFETLKETGGLKGIANFPGDYNAPYMFIMALLTYIPINPVFLIKGLSLIFDYVLAFSSGLLIYDITKDKKKSLLSSLLMLFLPQIAMNSGMWGQCDAIYCSFIIFSLLFLLKKKYTWSFIFLGIAFSFKLQFIFILPVYIIIYLKERNFSFYNFLLLPIVNLIMCLPAIICGKSLIECFSIYFNQTNTYQDFITLNYPNLYQFIKTGGTYFNFYAIAITMIICMSTLYFILKNKIKFNKEKILLLSTWFIYVVVFFLPNMHERYLFVGEILAVIYYICYKKHLFTAIWLNIIAFNIYLNFLTGPTGINMGLLAIANFAVLILFSREIFKSLLDKKEKER